MSQTFVEESHQLIKIATPLVISQLTLMSMGLTDVLIAGWAGKAELAGMMLGMNMTNMVIFLFFGVGIAAQPIVGYCYGEGSRLKMRRKIQQMLWTTLCCGILSACCLFMLYRILDFLAYEVAMKTIAKDYIIIMLGTAVAFPVIGALRGSLDGMKQSRKFIPINVVAFLINIPLDYGLVFGKWGLPEMGASGCALATVIIHWLMIIAGLWILKYHKLNRQLRIFKIYFPPDITEMKQIVKLGLPIGASIIAEMGFFSLIGVLIAFLGETVAAAHAIAMGIAGFFYMIYLGIGQAVTVRASNFMGANQDFEAWYSCKVGIIVGLLAALPPMFIIYIWKTPIAALFNDDANVIAAASVLLFWAIVFQIGDSLQAVVLCALRAYRITSEALLYQCIAFWIIAFPIGYILLKTQYLSFATGASAYWFAMVFGLTLTGVLLLHKLFRVVGQKKLIID